MPATDTSSREKEVVEGTFLFLFLCMNKDLRKKTTHARSTKCSQTTMAVQIDDTGRLALLGLARFLSHNPNVNTIDEVWLKPSLRDDWQGHGCSLAPLQVPKRFETIESQTFGCQGPLELKFFRS
jgi:hypothetical protein